MRTEGRYLLVDAAGPLVQTGLWREGRWIEWHGSREEAGRSLFSGVQNVFNNQQVSLNDLHGFFFCEGPGSMLGIRMAAMAIRGWQSLLEAPLPVFTYNSHGLLARALLARPVRPPFHIVSDARRSRWNVTTVAATGTVGELRRLATEEVAQLDDPLYRMEEPIRAEPPVPPAEVLPYDLEQQAERFLEAGLLRETPASDPLTQEAPQYQKWHADRHR